MPAAAEPQGNGSRDGAAGQIASMTRPRRWPTTSAAMNPSSCGSVAVGTIVWDEVSPGETHGLTGPARYRRGRVCRSVGKLNALPFLHCADPVPHLAHACWISEGMRNARPILDRRACGSARVPCATGEKDDLTPGESSAGSSRRAGGLRSISSARWIESGWWATWVNCLRRR
jgi:hypothetical protein